MELIQFITKHKKLSFICASIAVCVYVSMSLFILELPIWLIVIADFIFILVVYFFVNNCNILLYKKPISELNDNCDPYPFYDLIELLLTYKSSKEMRNMLLLQYVTALTVVGETQKALNILNSININENPIQSYRMLYYHNLMVIHCGLGNFEEAKRCYPELMNSLSKMKNQKYKQTVESNTLFAEMLKSFCDEEYDKTIQLLNGYKTENRRDEVSVAMYYAKSYLALNEPEKAKEKIEFIIENGNKLHCVTAAREMLNNLAL